MTWYCSELGAPAQGAVDLPAKPGNYSYGSFQGNYTRSLSWNFILAYCMRQRSPAWPVSRTNFSSIFGLGVCAYAYMFTSINNASGYNGKFQISSGGLGVGCSGPYFHNGSGANNSSAVTFGARKLALADYVETGTGWRCIRGKTGTNQVLFNENPSTVTGVMALGYGCSSSYPDADYYAMGRTATLVAPIDSQDYTQDGSLDVAVGANIAAAGSGYKLIDIAFYFNDATLPVGTKVNTEFKKMFTRAAFGGALQGPYGFGDFRSAWLNTVASAQPLKLKIYTGTIPSDPDAAIADTLLVTINLYTDYFSWPDAFGKFYAASAYSGTAVASGTAGYAVYEGCYAQDGATYARMMLPVATTEDNNQITLNSLSITSGGSVQASGLGFHFSVGQ